MFSSLFPFFLNRYTREERKRKKFDYWNVFGIFFFFEIHFQGYLSRMYFSIGRIILVQINIHFSVDLDLYRRYRKRMNFSFSFFFANFFVCVYLYVCVYVWFVNCVWIQKIATMKTGLAVLLRLFIKYVMLMVFRFSFYYFNKNSLYIHTH